jgi:hypothetical protein
MYRHRGPKEMRPVGETEFVNGVATMFASGTLGRPRACAGIVGRANLTLGGRVEPVLLLAAGCTPRLDGEHNVTVTAQLEVASGCVSCVPAIVPPSLSPGDVGTQD